MDKEAVPKESEKIAKRRARRMNERIKLAHQSLITKDGWLVENISDVLLVAILFLINAYIAMPIFGTHAIEVPFSGPVIPLMSKAISFTGIPFGYATQIVYLIFFLAFPISFYYFVKVVSDNSYVAFFSGLVASLPVFPFGRNRVLSGFNSGAGPHIASLALIPLALYFVLKFLREGKFNNMLVAIIASAVVALTSPFGFFMYLIFALITTFSEMLLGKGRLKFSRLITIFVLVAGAVSFWYNPHFISRMVFGALGADIRGTISRLVPLSFFSVPVLVTFGYLLFDRRPNLQPVFLASFYTIAFVLIVSAGGGLFPSNPSRYMVELGVALSFAAAIIVIYSLDYVRKNKLVKLSLPLVRGDFTSILSTILTVGMLASILFGRSYIYQTDVQVLGLWTGVSKGEIWLARDDVSMAFEILGYVISAATVISLAFLQKSMRGAKSAG